jgi:hypothetical protein
MGTHTCTSSDPGTGLTEENPNTLEILGTFTCTDTDSGSRETTDTDTTDTDAADTDATEATAGFDTLTRGLSLCSNLNLLYIFQI